MIFDGFVAPAARHRPARDAGVARLARRGRRRPGQGTGPGFLMSQLLERAQRAQRRHPARRSPRRTSTPSRRRAAVVPRRRALERRIRAFIRWNAAVDGHPGQQAGRRHRRPPLDVRLARPRCTRSGFNHFFRGKDDGHARRPRLHPGPRRARHLRPGLPRGPPRRGPPRPLPPRDRRRRACRATRTRGSCPSSGSTRRSRWASARSTRSTRPASTATCTTARSTTPADARGCGASSATARSTSPRRSARISLAGTRAARQPHLGRQLQPPAPRRPGAGQRQDHPGARGDLPGRRAGTSSRSSGARSGTSCSPATSTACCSTR